MKAQALAPNRGGGFFMPARGAQKVCVGTTFSRSVKKERDSALLLLSFAFSLCWSISDRGLAVAVFLAVAYFGCLTLLSLCTTFREWAKAHTLLSDNQTPTKGKKCISQH
jgi:hypothetical protein